MRVRYKTTSTSEQFDSGVFPFRCIGMVAQVTVVKCIFVSSVQTRIVSATIPVTLFFIGGCAIRIQREWSVRHATVPEYKNSEYVFSQATDE